ncbi:MAG: PDZ domain-containing protein [Deltaproteobacteria bacterium]|nr:PDZ domain-containing protein [Deltaproteobacteria bacterium]
MLLAAIVCAAGAAGCTTPIKQPLLTLPQQRLNVESFDYIWTTISEQHYDPAFGGLDWQAVRDELRPKIKNTRTMAEARVIIRDMISRLKLSHFSIIPGNLYVNVDRPAPQHAEPGVIGIDIRLLDDQVIVTRVKEGRPAEKLGVRPGWRIIRIDGDNVAEKMILLEQALKEETGKNWAFTSIIQSRLTGRAGETIQVDFLDGENQTRSLEIPLVRAQGKKYKLGYLPAFYVWIKTRTIEPGIGYISFNAFFDPVNVMPVYNKAMISFMNNKGLIIDLRGNPGGIMGMIQGMASWLVDENQVFGTMYLRDNALQIAINPRAVTYTGPVAILIDGLSASSAEIFAGGLQDHGRARIFGEQSAGAALPSSFAKLPNHDLFQYAFTNFRLSSGREIEGTGVQPDVVIRQTRQTLLEGRDLVLEAAVEWIKTEE